MTFTLASLASGASALSARHCCNRNAATMVNKHCCYGLCKSDSRHKDKPHMEGVVWFPFPKPSKDLEKCRKWVKLCGRPEQCFNVSKINKDVYICSKHFVGGKGPSKEYPDPFPANSSETETSSFLKKKRRKSPKKRETGPSSTEDVVIVRPKLPLYLQLPPADAANRAAEASPSKSMDHWNMAQVLNEQSPEKENVQIGQQGESTKKTPKLLRYALLKEQEFTKPQMRTTGTQTVLQRKTEDGQSTLLSELTDEELSMDTKTYKRRAFMADVFRSDAKCKFYTGLTLVLFNAVLGLVSSAAKKMNYWRGSETGRRDLQRQRQERLLTLREEFLLVLLRLRRGFNVEVVADLMGVSTAHVSRVFVTWIHLLAKKLGKLLIKWPCKRQVQRRLPRAFKHFRNTRCIIDCTEFILQKPSVPSVQRKSYSNYKHRNTAKCLVAVTPRGVFSFVSDLWTGSISDRRIVERSGFLDLIEPFDDVMADRGFTIRDLLTVRGATLNIPPFAHGKQLSQAAVTKTRRIAAVRIHVERAIGRLKAFRLIGETIPALLQPVINECVLVAAALCNLDKPLCK